MCGQPLPKYMKDGASASPLSNKTSTSPAPHATRPLTHREPSNSYMARYWRGEIPLAHSFWITNVAVDLGIWLLENALESRLATTKSPLLLHQLSLALSLFSVFLLGVWQVVGLWRSARQYIASTQCLFWGRCAQGAVVLWAMLMVGTYPVWLPAYIADIQIAFGDKDFQYRLTVSDDGDTLELDGGIGLGLTKAVTEQLNQHPQIELVSLNSHGGLLKEARDLSALIEQRGLSTYSGGECLSACTSLFLAGTRRILHADAKLGFHKSSILGMPESVNDLRNAPDKEYMRKRGINNEFIEKAFSAPTDDLWVPTVQELVDATVVTHVFDGSRTVAYSK